MAEDCRECALWERCPCGKTGHKNGTSVGYSIGECKMYDPIEIARQYAPKFDKPVVDMVEIVQCKDCRYCSITPVAGVGATYECLWFRKRFGITIHMMPTDFCSKGRRRPAK